MNEVKGWRTTQGSVANQDLPLGKNNAPLIERLLEAGAVLHIQTTVPELFLNSQTWTKLWGVTRNPWNLAYAVGGSTGGGGAALAAGFTTLSTGSDIGGSIRIPSAYGGLYGFKPPFGRVPTLSIPYTPADFDPSKLPNPETNLNTLYMVLTYPWNMLSRYPVVNVPIGIAPNQVPIGMQVVGNTYDDLAAFRVASAYSKVGLHLYGENKFPDYRNKK